MSLSANISGTVENDDISRMHFERNGAEILAIVSVIVDDIIAGVPRSSSVTHVVSQNLKDAITAELPAIRASIANAFGL